MTIKEAYLKSKQTLSVLYEENEAISICRRLFEDVFLIRPNDLILRSTETFNDELKLKECLKRLSAYEPIQHITGFEHFQGLQISVNQDVLIPRPETSELIDWVVLNEKHPRLMADICTGSACIALALKKHFASAEIIATDISEKALIVARKNEESNFKTKDIHFELHDILSEPWSFGMPDVIICNPPYIAVQEAALMTDNVMKYEPQQALFVYDQDALLFYKRIIHLFLPGPAVIYFELNPLTAEELKIFCDQKGIKSLFREDLFGKIRFARIYS